jgi:hypothetical protein
VPTPLHLRARAADRIALPRGPLKAPERIRIWRAGDNPGDYGSNVFDDVAAASVMAEFLARGNAGAIDLEHGTNPDANPALDPSDPPIMGGYYALEVVGGELWAEVRWSDCGRPHAEAGTVCCARHQIESGQRCYVSPDWDLDPETRRPVRLHKLSLVAEPGTYAIPMLASRQWAAARSTIPMNDLEQIRQGIALWQGIAESAQDPNIKKMASELVAMVTTALASVGIDVGGAAVDVAPPSDAMGGAPPAADAMAAAPPAEEPKPEMAAAAPEKTEEEKTAAAAQIAASMKVASEKLIAALAASTALKAPAAPLARPRASAPTAPTAAPTLTAAQVQAMIAEEREKTSLIAAAANRPGMTPALASLLASKPLADVRTTIAAMAPAPAAPSDVPAGRIPTRAAAMPGGAAQPEPKSVLAGVVTKLRASVAGDFKPVSAADVGIRSLALQLAPQTERLDELAKRITAGEPLGVHNVRATADRVRAREVARYRATAAPTGTATG